MVDAVAQRDCIRLTEPVCHQRLTSHTLLHQRVKCDATAHYCLHCVVHGRARLQPVHGLPQRVVNGEYRACDRFFAWRAHGLLRLAQQEQRQRRIFARVKIELACASVAGL